LNCGIGDDRNHVTNPAWAFSVFENEIDVAAKIEKIKKGSEISPKAQIANDRKREHSVAEKAQPALLKRS
jgi:hypothetical protein